ncbi:MAG: hypothetical protein ABIT38_07360 [Gemmatimonadaceae bacterium]
MSGADVAAVLALGVGAGDGEVLVALGAELQALANKGIASAAKIILIAIKTLRKSVKTEGRSYAAVRCAESARATGMR